MKKILSIPALCILCVSCSKDSNSNENSNGNYENTYYHGDNEESQADWEITANVKKSLMTGNSLSSSARMVSVTTNNGVVTLKGSVASKEEMAKVIRIVEGVSGVTRVENHLTVSKS